MAWQSTPFTVPMFVSGLFSLALAVYVASYGYRDGFDRTLVALGLVLVFAAEWAFASSLTLASATRSGKLFWSAFTPPGAHGIILAWLALTLSYTDRDEWLTPRRFGPLVALAVVSISLNYLGPLSLKTVRVVSNGEFAVLVTSPTPLGLAFQLFFISVVLVGIYLLLRLMVGPQQLYRGQAIALALAATFPLLAYLVALLKLGPYPDVNLAPIAFVLTGAALTYAIVRYRLLDLTPVVRDTVVETMQEGYVVVDDGRVLDLNQAARTLLDAPDDPLGDPVAELFEADFEESLAGDEPVTDQEVTVETNGRKRHLSVRSSTVDREGVGQLLLVEDVTDRRQVERRYQTLIEYASDVTGIIDPEGQFVYVSPAAERILGYDPETLVDREALDIVVPADQSHVRSAFEDLGDEPGGSTRLEFRIEDADGTVRVFETVVRNLVHEPAVEGFVLNAWEVTERKERTRQLEVLNRLLRHDISNDLQIINLTTQSLEAHVDEAGAEQLQRLQTSIDHAVELTETVRDLLEAMGPDETEFQLTSLAPVIENEVERLAEPSESATVTVEGTIPEVTVLANEMLSSVFRNLLINAVQHNDTDDPTVTVTVDRTTALPKSRRPENDPVPAGDGDSAGDWVIVRVADDGPGVPADRRDEVFGRGEQGIESEGTGIGLYLVRTLVESYGGDVWVEDNEPRGAVFAVSLPIADEPASG